MTVTNGRNWVFWQGTFQLRVRREEVRSQQSRVRSPDSEVQRLSSGQLRAVFSFDAVGDGVFFDVEADFGLGRQRWRLEQRAQLLVDVAQRDIVHQQGFIYFGQAFEDGCVGREFFAHFDEGTDEIDAHRNGPGAVEDICRHKAPCSVKARGSTGENLRRPRWSQFATTSAVSV